MTYNGSRERQLPFPTLHVQIKYFNPVIINGFGWHFKFCTNGIITILDPFEWLVADIFLNSFQFTIIPNDTIVKTFLPNRYPYKTSQFVDTCRRSRFECADEVTEGFKFYIIIRRDGRLPIPTGINIFPRSGMQPI